MSTIYNREKDLLVCSLLLMMLCVIPSGSEGAIQCYQCHGTSASDYRPADTVSRNYSTGGFTGNHRSHMAAPANPNTCRKCHNNQNYTSSHRNGFINLSSNINSSPLKGKYINGVSQITSKDQSTTPVLGSCADVNCHFETVTPQWGTDLFTASADCDKCHGTPPNGSATSGLAGSHAKHAQYYPGTVNCQKCHSNNTTFQHATSAGKRNLNISFAAAPNNGSGAYSGEINDYLPSQSNSFGSCTATYCHSPGNKNSPLFSAPSQTATWGGTLGCNGCHATATGIQLGSHYRHVASTYGMPVKCYKCHVETVTAEMTVSSTANHVNKKVDVAFNSTTTALFGKYSARFTPMQKTPGSGFGNCENVYCHSNAQGAGGMGAPTYSAPKWGNSATGRCPSCHGAGIHTAVPIASGSHTKHLGYDFDGARSSNMCGSCHWGAGFAAASCMQCHTASGKLTTLHVNHKVDVSFTTKFGGTYNGSPEPGDGYSTCSNVYCHSNGLATPTSYYTPTWGNTASGACGTCHGAKADAPPASAAHAKHVGSSSLYLVACSQCHAGIVKHGTDSITYTMISTAVVPGTIDGSKLHVNKSRNVRFDTIHSGATYTSATQTCANTYCHSKGTSVSSGAIQPNTINWGTPGPLACNSCHGNTTYGSDYRKAAPLYASGSPKGNAHQAHINTGSLNGTDKQCFSCHAATTRNNTSIAGTAQHVNRSYNIASIFGEFSSVFPDGDNTINSTKVTINYNYNASGSSCSNVSCHSIGLDITTVPATPKTRATSLVKWDNSSLCIDCHNNDMQNTTTFHHAMRNYSSGYPLQSPYSSASTGVNAYARRCTMCHVGHNIFSPDLNSSNSLGRAGNLRTDIAVLPTASSGYSNNDYIKSAGGSGGICISCHSTAKAKDTTRRKNDYPANVTPVITQAQYSASGHQYNVSAKFMSDGSIVYGNCSKCHNALLGETSVFMNATSAYQFGNHNSGVRRLQGTLGAAGGETAEEQICYRCHSLITDPDPGGGPPKAVANMDFYGAASMTLASQDIFEANLDFRTVNPTYSTTGKLYFKPTAAENPVAPMPSGHNTGDPFAGGTWIGRSMSPWESTTPYETKNQITSATGTNYWRMVSFTSPTVYSTTTVPAGNWVINVYCRESSTSQNAKIRYMVYKWNATNTLGTTIIAKGTYATELATTAAPGAVRQIAVNVEATTLTAGEKIVVDLELDTTSSYTTSYTASFYFGSRAPSDLSLPGNVNWSYADPGAAGFGHATQHYAGVHLPSTKNETLSYISQNKHIECVDCHNPHATRNGLHGDYGIATGGSTTTLVNNNKHWVTNQWVGAYVSLIPATPATTSPIATITGNTATTLTTTTYSGTWVAPAAGDVYRIIKNTNKVSPSQRSVPGASVTYSGAWTSGTYSMVEESTYEYQICFKCHAGANTNVTTWGGAGNYGTGAAAWTDVGLEFNPNNKSYHPVVQPLPASGTPRRLEPGALTGGWKAGDVMSCSDCHGRDTSTSATAQGPHGSTVKWMLTGKYQNWPFTSAAANGTAAGGTLILGTGTATYPTPNFCFNCHTWEAGGFGHTKSSGGHAKACVVCHIRVPHGGKMPRLLTSPNAPARYKPDGNGGGATISLTSARLPATGYMGKTDVSCNGCGGHPAQTFPVAGGTYW